MNPEKRWKYIVIEHPEFDGLEIPVIFPEALKHKHVAQLGRGGKVHSAGFCKIYSTLGVAEAHGESEGLGLKSRGEVDAKLLRTCYCGTTPPAYSQSPKETAKT